MESNLRRKKTNPNNNENLLFGFELFFFESNHNWVILYIKDLPSPLYTYKALGCVSEERMGET